MKKITKTAPHLISHIFIPNLAAVAFIKHFMFLLLPVSPSPGFLPT